MSITKNRSISNNLKKSKKKNISNNKNLNYLLKNLNNNNNQNSNYIIQSGGYLNGKILVLDFDQTFLKEHSNGQPIITNKVLSDADKEDYKKNLTELLKYFNKIYINTRGLKEEITQWLKTNGLFGENLIDSVYGADVVNKTDITVDKPLAIKEIDDFWAKQKVIFLNKIATKHNITDKSKIYFYDDTDLNIKEAKKSDQFINSFTVPTKIENNKNINGGTTLLNKILEDIPVGSINNLINDGSFELIKTIYDSDTTRYNSEKVKIDALQKKKESKNFENFKSFTYDSEKILTELIRISKLAPAPATATATPQPHANPDMPVITKDMIIQNNYNFIKLENKFKDATDLTDPEKVNLKTLYSQPGGWGDWFPSNDGTATYYIAVDNNINKYLGSISNLKSPTRKTNYILKALIDNNAFGKDIYTNAIIGEETAGVIIANELRTTLLFSDLFYYYLNEISGNTWLWTTDIKNIAKYNAIGYDLIYDNDGEKKLIGTNLITINYKPLFKDGKYYMVHLESGSITGTPNNTEFVKIPCVNQNHDITYIHGCGFFVLVNSLLITFLAKQKNHKINDLELLNDSELIKYFVNYMSYVFIKYAQYMVSKGISDEDINTYILIFGEQFATITNPENINEHTLNYQAYDLKTLDNITNFDKAFENKFYIKETGAIVEFKNDFHWNIPSPPAPSVEKILLNIDWLKTNVIVVQNSFDNNNVSVFCSSIMFNSKILKNLKNFYKLDNYILTFIIGNKGHWKCYTVNKYKDPHNSIKKQHLYLDSINGIINNKIAKKIIELTSESSYEDLIINILKCYNVATSEATYTEYTGYLDNMFTLLLTERSIKNKINNYNDFVKTLITRIINEDIKFFNTNNNKALISCQQEIIVKIDKIIDESNVTDDIKQHYYMELSKHLKDGNNKVDENYETHCKTKFSSNTNRGLSALKKAPTQSDNILAMSYNVCWGCVTQNTGDATAQPLPQTCKDRTTTGKENICLLNVAKVFDEVEKEAGQELDLVGTQESAKWEDIIKHSQALKKMKYVHHTTKDNINYYIEFLSLYNGDKFTLDALKYGNLDDTNNEGRPYHILFLTHKVNKIKYIFINIHNGKGDNFKADNLSEIFSKNINLVYKTQEDNSNITIPYTDKDKFKEDHDFIGELKLNDYSIIFMGDINEIMNYNLWNGFKPFDKSSFSKINKNVSSKTVKPPKTCCDVNLQNNHSLIGDYILIDDGLSFDKNNTIPQYSLDNTGIPSSDHLPIYAIIKPLHVMSTPTITNVGGYLSKKKTKTKTNKDKNCVKRSKKI